MRGCQCEAPDNKAEVLELSHYAPINALISTRKVERLVVLARMMGNQTETAIVA